VRNDSCITVKQLEQEVLFTFPVEQQRLDVFRHFLWPEKAQIKSHKRIESLAIMLQMVEHQRGVCVLPQWLADSYSEEYKIKPLRLGANGIYSTLYACIKTEDKSVSYINEFIKLGKVSPL
jgi:LysR family transcriptional regulator for metE and metH